VTSFVHFSFWSAKVLENIMQCSKNILCICCHSFFFFLSGLYKHIFIKLLFFTVSLTLRNSSHIHNSFLTNKNQTHIYHYLVFPHSYAFPFLNCAIFLFFFIFLLFICAYNTWIICLPCPYVIHFYSSWILRTTLSMKVLKHIHTYSFF
jgi:hypothetical protein